jgi:hypothetical protein
VSARPELERMAPEDLDLLISRSIDGDLSPEEETDLKRHLENDAAARRRYEEMARLVERMQSLPSPEPPFALATRINSSVSQASRGVGSLWLRLGLYPPPGLAVAAAGVLALVVVSGVFLNRKPAPVSVAENAEQKDGPVTVFFQDSDPSAPREGRQAAASADKDSREQAAEPAKAKAAGEALKKDAIERDASKNEKQREQQKEDRKEEQRGARRDTRSEPAFAQEMPAQAGATADALGAMSAPQAPQKEAALAPAPAAAAEMRSNVASKAPRAADEKARSASSVSVEVFATDGRPSSWRVASRPSASPAGPVDGVFRVTLDLEGRVTGVVVRSGHLPLDLERFLRGLVFAGEEGEKAPPELDLKLRSR